MTYYVVALAKAGGPERKVRHIGQYDNHDDAVAAAKHTVDEFIGRAIKAGVSNEALFLAYKQYGNYPVIFEDNDKTYNVPGFNHFKYGLSRCASLSGRKPRQG